MYNCTYKLELHSFIHHNICVMWRFIPQIHHTDHAIILRTYTRAHVCDWQLFFFHHTNILSSTEYVYGSSRYTIHAYTNGCTVIPCVILYRRTFHGVGVEKKIGYCLDVYCPKIRFITLVLWISSYKSCQFQTSEKNILSILERIEKKTNSTYLVWRVYRMLPNQLKATNQRYFFSHLESIGFICTCYCAPVGAVRVFFHLFFGHKTPTNNIRFNSKCGICFPSLPLHVIVILKCANSNHFSRYS